MQGRTGSFAKSSVRTRRRGLVAALAAAALVLLVGAGAQAKDEFEHAFKYELGRIAAHEAVYAGKTLLGAVLLGYPPGAVPVYAPYPAYGYGHGHRGHHPPGHYKHHKHGKHRGASHVYIVERESHHYYSDGCGHRDRGHVHDHH
ncbi:MAG: hypothetical protein JSU66_16860 [Deltaproteobacteria bacterium]|nr:MAG: hypothetical protein JSU66_16860 [Deltaproteobacteria bacterium]